jgi:hypothetical protein
VPKNASLISGRNTEPLDDRKVNAVVNTFYGLDKEALVRYDPAARTVFRTYFEGTELKHEIVFGPDILPGIAVGDPTSVLGMKSAVAHELTHKARHLDSTEIDEEDLMHIDEAMTSLGAIMRFRTSLEEFDVLQLVSDAYQRLQHHVAALRAAAAAGEAASPEGAAK